MVVITVADRDNEPLTIDNREPQARLLSSCNWRSGAAALKPDEDCAWLARRSMRGGASLKFAED